MLECKPSKFSLWCLQRRGAGQVQAIKFCPCEVLPSFSCTILVVFTFSSAFAVPGSSHYCWQSGHTVGCLMFGKPLFMTGQCSQQLHEVYKNWKICYLWVNIFATIISAFGMSYHLHFKAEIKYSITIEESAIHFNFSCLNTSEKQFLWSLRWAVTCSNMHFINTIIYTSEPLLAISWYLPFFLKERGRAACGASQLHIHFWESDQVSSCSDFE